MGKKCQVMLIEVDNGYWTQTIKAVIPHTFDPLYRYTIKSFKVSHGMELPEGCSFEETILKADD